MLAASPAFAAEDGAPTVKGEIEATLRGLIQRALIGVGGASPSRFEARRRARQGADNASAVLRSEGYYAENVEADVAEDGTNSLPVLTVTPGPQFLVAAPQVLWAVPEPEPAAARAATGAMKLEPGQPGRAADVLAAEGRLVAAIQGQGYADAAPQPRVVIVDHTDHTLRPTFNIASGPKVLLGPVQLSTKGRTNPVWVSGLAPWRVREVYVPDRVAELERRLRETGVYDQVSVALRPADQGLVDNARPILVTLADRAPRTVELGAGYSTSEGAGLDGRLLIYNRLRRADTLTFTARLAQIEQKLDGEVSLPQWRGPQQTLKMGADIYNENTDAFNETGVGTRFDITRRYGRAVYNTSYRTLGASLDVARVRDATSAGGETYGVARDLVTVATLAALALDRSDDPLNPKRGWRVEARTEPTVIFGETRTQFLKTQVQGSAYLPIGALANTVLAGRLKLGAIVGGTIPGVPASRRFFAGGGGSVRGYAYQAIGPRLDDNTPVGGVSLAEASFEVRQKVTQRWSGVAFVDVGGVGGSNRVGLPSRDDFSAGVGFGVRYDLGFGPIRADIAFPLDKRDGDPAFQLYLSIGQSF
jgi:translocation and assembly module TamA